MIQAPAACVTTGAAAALDLSAAACIAGQDMKRIVRLPDTEGMPHDIVIHRKPPGSVGEAFLHEPAA